MPAIRTEYVPEPLYDETAPADHAAAMAPRLLAALRHYDPAAIVFDGNVPRDALLAACAEVERRWSGCAAACGAPTRRWPAIWR